MIYIQGADLAHAFDQVKVTTGVKPGHKGRLAAHLGLKNSSSISNWQKTGIRNQSTAESVSAWFAERGVALAVNGHAYHAEEHQDVPHLRLRVKTAM